MNNFIVRSKEILENGSVGVVIGYEKGTGGVSRPVFITDPNDTDRLVYDEQCKHNLATYLTKPEVKKFGRIGIFAALPVMRSILMLVSEQQVSPGDIIVLGFSEDGRMIEFSDIQVMKDFVGKHDAGNPPDQKQLIDELKKLKPEERFAYWQKELSKCIKCYACRQTCPMCYCTRCTVEVNQPQWIPVKANLHGNLEWHILRAMHLAGRCISCGECGRACPVGIPCNLLTMYLADVVHDYFGVRAGLTDKMSPVLSVFELNDKESFIK